MILFPHIDIEKTCCFTGPRPEKTLDNEYMIKYYARLAVLEAIEQGYTHFLSGMSRGFDLFASEVVIQLQDEYDITLIAVIPFVEQSKTWGLKDKLLYEKILSKARYTVCIAEKYRQSLYFARNMFMVNHSSKVISYYRNTGGGTKHTLDYATKKGIDIVNVADYFEY